MAVPQQRGHRPLYRRPRPLDVDGTVIPSQGPGVPQPGYTFCTCGVGSRVLPSDRERKLWHTKHREKIAGVPWK
jgi:hypothetical protein